jgi:hypothetical protein
VYRCQVCGEVVPANTPALRKVIETRRREYPRRPKANQFRREGRKEHTDDPGGVGTEILLDPTPEEVEIARSGDLWKIWNSGRPRLLAPEAWDWIGFGE